MNEVQANILEVLRSELEELEELQEKMSEFQAGLTDLQHHEFAPALAIVDDKADELRDKLSKAESHIKNN